MRLADPSQDTFNPLGGTAADFPLHKELVVYATGEKILCWGFNCRDSQETCLSETTDEAIFFGEAAFATHHQSLQNAMGKLQVLFKGMGTECGSIETADILKPTFNV